MISNFSKLLLQVIQQIKIYDLKSSRFDFQNYQRSTLNSTNMLEINIKMCHLSDNRDWSAFSYYLN